MHVITRTTADCIYKGVNLFIYHERSKVQKLVLSQFKNILNEQYSSALLGKRCAKQNAVPSDV